MAHKQADTFDKEGEKRYEAKFIQTIVEEISRELRFINSSVDGKLIGMETRIKDVVSSLETDIYDVRMIGIKGMGGAGKTTLARVVFDQIFSRFEGSSFVENVREKSKNPLCGLTSLQKQVLSDVLNAPDITINGVYEGKNLMKERMCRKKVLVVLDDVDHLDQLEALVGELSWFKPGSRVIITTREEQVLVAYGVPMNMILDVSLLSHEEANCLFNRYAFGREIPNQGYKVLSRQVLRYAAGLPLTIKVLGSFLRGKDELEWTDALERLKTIPLKETQEILELSYHGLEEDYKEIFLDVACVLKGWEKERATRALESCDLHARSGLRVLEQKSLITLSNNGRLGMHDHIEEMGKNIVRRSYPNAPYRHSRLWIREEIEDILVEDKDTKATRCITLKLLDSDIKGLRKMKELRFLQVNNRWENYSQLIDYDPDYDNVPEDSILPNGLRYICWNYYPYTCLPKNFLGNNLVGLEIHHSKICQLWKGGEKKVLKKIRFIDVTFCNLKTFDIGLTMNLERLHLDNCPHLVELHTPNESFKLKFLSIVYCKLIKTLDLMWAHNLETLEVIRCEDLVELRMPVESLKLKHLILEMSKLKTLNLLGARNLETLKVKECEDLAELHMRVECLNLKHLILKCSKWKTLNLMGAQNLKILDLECEYLLVLHMPIECLNLKRLILKCSKLKTLNLMGAQNLEILDLECECLVELHMPVECLNLKQLILKCSKLKTLNLVGAQNLEILDLECEDLVELHMPVENSKLKHLSLQHCSKFKALNLTRTKNLEKLNLAKCKDLVELHMPVKNFKLKSVNFYCCKLRTLDLGWAKNLDYLYIEEHEDLVELHLAIEKIEKLGVQRCSKLKTINLTRTQNIETLRLVQCEDLAELHMPIESHELKIIEICYSKLKTLNLTRTRNIKKLRLLQCDNLLELHMPVENHKLNIIEIYSSKLKTLYLGLYPYLERLDLHGCYNLVEMHAPIACLSGSVMFKQCLVNQGFPMDGSLAELHIIVRSLGICPLHPNNNLPKSHFECIYKELLLSSVQNLAKLISFSLCACANLASLPGIICGVQLRKLTLEGSILEVPKELEKLECLEELSLLSTKIEYFQDNICMLKHLKFLRFKSCWFLKQLPEAIGRLECLEELHLRDCTSLLDIPNSICEMKRLRCFHLIDCILVEKLPKEMGRLKCLKELNIKGTSIRDFPPSIFHLEDLVFLL